MSNNDVHINLKGDVKNSLKPHHGSKNKGAENHLGTFMKNFVVSVVSKILANNQTNYIYLTQKKETSRNLCEALLKCKTLLF